MGGHGSAGFYARCGGENDTAICSFLVIASMPMTPPQGANSMSALRLTRLPADRGIANNSGLWALLRSRRPEPNLRHRRQMNLGGDRRLHENSQSSCISPDQFRSQTCGVPAAHDWSSPDVLDRKAGISPA